MDAITLKDGITDEEICKGVFHDVVIPMRNGQWHITHERPNPYQQGK